MNSRILRLLGGAVIESDGVPLGGPAAHRHRLALLALLAVSRRPVSRDKLMAYLWPERDTDSARNLLRTALYELRKLLGDDAIRSTGDALGIDPSVIRCDVPEFEAAVGAGDVETAASLYAGPFLDGFHIKEASEFEHWVDGERARLERVHQGVMARMRDRPPVVLQPVDTAPLAQPPIATVEAPVEHRRGRLFRIAAPIAVVVIASLSAVLIASARHASRSADAAPRPVLLADGAPGTALEFDGRTATASTDAGRVVTTQTDNIAIDMMVRYEGRLTKKQQILIYNGHGAVSGWGLMLIGAEDTRPDGTITVLAGGINIMATPLVLERGVWQHVSAERRNGQFTVTLDDSSFAVGDLPVNPIGGEHRAIEHTSIGGDGLYDAPSLSFHGAIDRVRIRDLAGAYWIERWFFDDAKGALAVGARGTVLHVGTARWVPGPRLTTQAVFWSRLESLCNQAFSGRVHDSTAVLHVMQCEPNEIRIAVPVGTDRSRTFVLTKHATTLGLRVERHRQNGSENASGRYVGVTADSGSFGAQEFVGNAGRDVVRIELEPGKLLSYVWRRRGAEREHMQFDLHRQVATPPLPWGVD